VIGIATSDPFPMQTLIAQKIECNLSI
jgi:hypothetical protein